MTDSDQVWEQGWAGEQPLFKQYAQAERLVKCRNVIGNVAGQFLVYGANGFIRAFLTKKGYREIQEDGKKLLDPQTASRTVREINSAVNEFWKTAKRLRIMVQEKEDLRSLHDKTLVNLFKEFDWLVIRIFAYFLNTWEATVYHAEEKLKKTLEARDPRRWEEAFFTLTTPSEPDLLLREKTAWLKVLKKPSKNGIEKHMLECPFLFQNIDSEKAAFEIMLKRAKTDSPQEIGSEIIASRKRLQKTRAAQNGIFKKTKSKEIRNLAFLLQQFALLRLELKNCWTGIHFYLFPLFASISKATGSSVRDVMMFWSMKDIAKFLETGFAVPGKELEKRKESYLLLLEKGKINLYSGEEARRIKSAALDKFLPARVREFRGSVASKGTAKGEVRVINFDDLRLIEKMAEEIREKFVLVAGMTNPNMMPLIKKAKAIVTDEGGMTCHAAIISREFGIPCIVGTKIATRALKDGDIVEVDADKGIVRKQ